MTADEVATLRAENEALRARLRVIAARIAERLRQETSRRDALVAHGCYPDTVIASSDGVISGLEVAARIVVRP